MKPLVKKFWNEPAAAIGLFTSLVLLVLQLIGDSHFTADTIIAIVAPLASGLGIRQLVSPDTTAGPIETAVTPDGP